MKILITGGTGMVGSAFKKILPDAVYISSKDYDLIRGSSCADMFVEHEPDCVIHLAAKVGGIKANTDYIGQFYNQNMLINSNVLNCARGFGVQKVVSILSTCVYPDKTTYPLVEKNIHCGEPHRSNFGYAYAKRMLDVQSRAYRQQYNSNFITAVPNNLYGEGDNFDLENSHVIPALVRKIWEAKLSNSPSVECWGTGKPLREFTYSEDIAKILVFLLNNYDDEGPINIGNTNEYSIKQIVELLCSLLDYEGEIIWNISKPSGQFRKPSSNEKLLGLGWKKEYYTPLEEGLKKTCEWFKLNYPNIRGISE
jgi:GDP-L-fucose synthase